MKLDINLCLKDVRKWMSFLLIFKKEYSIYKCINNRKVLNFTRRYGKIINIKHIM